MGFPPELLVGHELPRADAFACLGKKTDELAIGRALEARGPEPPLLRVSRQGLVDKVIS